MIKSRSTHGYTILELIVSVGIIAGMSIVVAQALFTSSKTNSKVEISKEVKQNGEYVMQVLERKIRNSHAIESTCAATPGTTSNTLDIKNSDDSITTLGCVVDGPLFRIGQITGGATTYLTSESVTMSACSDIQFICISSPSLPNSVVTSFSLSQTNGSGVYETADETFQSTITLRNR